MNDQDLLEHNPFADDPLQGFHSQPTRLSASPGLADNGTRDDDEEEDDAQLSGPFEQSMNLRKNDSEDTVKATEKPLPVASPEKAKITVQETPTRRATNVPHFEIRVADPITVGDGLKAYTAYTISIQTDCSDFKQRQFTAQRRFREFLWLEQQLGVNNPGVIVPPAPEKHAIGRFEEDFVENRRVLLERMLKKIASHPILHKDAAFRVFLESENFSVDAQEKKKDSSSGGGKFSFMSKLGDVMSSATNSFAKVPEIDPWFETKRAYFDQLESQLKQVAKAVDIMIKQREELAATTDEFAKSILTVASSEINQSIEKELTRFGEVQKEVTTYHDKQAKHDLYFLANTLDEYVRLMSSVKNAFQSRTKSFQNWQQAEATLVKHKISLEKTKLNHRTQKDKLTQIEADIAEAEQRVQSTKAEFEEVSRVLKEEIGYVDQEKVEDLQASVRGYLMFVVENQEGIVQSWQRYFEETGGVTVNGGSGHE